MAAIHASARGRRRLEIAERAVGTIWVDNVLRQRGDIAGGKRNAVSARQQCVMGGKQHVIARLQAGNTADMDHLAILRRLVGRPAGSVR